MKILIVGGTGYLGSRISKFLLECGHQVFIGTRADKQKTSSLKGAEFRIVEWNNNDSLVELCREMDVVIHAAGLNARECEESPLSALEINGIATAKLVNACKISNINKFIYFSTVHVYSARLTGCLSEESCPMNKHPYATSKLAAENYILSEIPFQGVVYRLTNAVGAPANPQANCWMLYVNDISKQAIDERKIYIRSSLNAYRDFIPIMKILEYVYREINDDKSYGVFNIGSGVSVTLLDMARLVADRCEYLFGYRPKVIYDVGMKETGSYLTVQGRKIDQYNNLNHELCEEIDGLLMLCQERVNTFDNKILQ